MLFAYDHQIRTKSTSTPDSPFKQLATLFAPHIAVGKASIGNQAYCLGLYRTRTPGNVGVASLNQLFLGFKKMPSIGTSSPGLEIYHHTGNLPGNTSSAFLIPSLGSAVVVLKNSLPLMDPTDFVEQLIISTLLNDLVTVDFVSLSNTARQASIASYRKLSAYLDKHKTTKPTQHPLSVYEGDYFSLAGKFFLSVSALNVGLLAKVNGWQRTSYNLLPYGGDTFYWPADRENEVAISLDFPIYGLISTHLHSAQVATGCSIALSGPLNLERRPKSFGGELDIKTRNHINSYVCL